MQNNSNKCSFTQLHQRTLGLLEGQTDSATIPRDQAIKLLRELQTYHADLELQNQELRSTNIELEQSRRRFIDLYDFAPVTYLTVNGRSTIIEANVAAADMFGVVREDLLGQPLSNFIVSSDQAIYFYNSSKLLETREKQSYELCFCKIDGSLFHAQVETVINSEVCNPPGQFRIMVSDISVRKKMELELHWLKDKYRNIVMDQKELICRFDLQGKITFVNDAYCQYYGVNYQEILETNFLPDVHKDDLQLVRNHFKNLTELNPEKTIEHRVHLPNGELRWQQWSGRALYDKKGKMVECQAVGRDITMLKQAEEKLLKESELRQLFMDALPCVALLLKRDSREIVASNRAAMEVGAVPGQQCYATWVQRETPCPWCQAQKLWQSGEAKNNQFWGQGIYWDAYWIPVDDTHYLHYAFDNTEQQKNKEALRKAHDECTQRVIERTLELKKSHQQLLHSEKLAAVGNLSASIVHEFNNPLQSITTIVQGIERYVPLDNHEGKLVGLALQECQRLKKLIANLKDFYQPSSGILSPVDIHETVDALLFLNKKNFATRHIEVKKNFADNIPPVMAVCDQMKQVFLNLFYNAADACDDGGTITLTTERVEDNAVVHVEDTGVGIEAENIAHVFEPFFTTKTQKKGTGLGLSVTYGIIKKHGGTIEVHSVPGEGSVFSVFWPIKGVQHG